MAKSENSHYKIYGTVTDENGKPIKGLLVRAFDQDPSTPDNPLGELVKTDQDGRYSITFTPDQFTKTKEAGGPDVFIRVYSDGAVLGQSQVQRNSGREIELSYHVKHVPGKDGWGDHSDQRSIKGQVFLTNMMPARNLLLKVYQKNFGADKLLRTIATDDFGYYSFEYEAGEDNLSYEIRAVDKKGEEVSLMHARFNTAQEEEMNLVAPENIQEIEPEYDRLMSAISPKAKGKRLGDAVENNQRQDITYLFQKTGWDARLIGMAALADKRSVDTGIPPNILYALFRTGMPTGSTELARMSEKSIEKAIQKANKAGIANIQLETAMSAFKEFALRHLRSNKTVGGLASINDFLNALNIPESEQSKLASVYFRENSKGGDFWKKVKAAGVSTGTIRKLQLQGKLSFLTLNNSALVNKLQQSIGEKGGLETLAKKGYYKAETWKDEIKKLAKRDSRSLKSCIPANFGGKNEEERLDAYANDMAVKIRASYPTETLSAMIEKDDLMLGEEHKEVKTFVSRFLSNAASLNGRNGGKKYAPGSTSFQAMMNENREKLMTGIPGDKATTTMHATKKLTRLYQLSPTADSLQKLYDLGFTSSFDVVNHTYKNWMKFYGDKFSSPQEAEVIYRKAQQTTSVIYNFYTAAQQLNTGVLLPVSSPEANEVSTVKDELIKRFPTLETLFGSLDYCECDHCRSVLSPAAYLVDILQFLDPDEATWKRNMDLWRERHNNAAYPGIKPYQALTNRRPDIPLIELSCANTNTALPYIDIVNEILECYVSGGQMEDVAYSTGEHTSAALIAEPQNIIPAAYDTLSTAIYPLTLPFDYSIRMVRNLADHFGIPFWKLLLTFRKTDDLFADGATNPWSMNDIFIEYLGLSAKEYDLFTNPSSAHWFLLYGYTSEAEAITKAVDTQTLQRIDLLSAKTLSNKVGLTYKELLELVKSHFINPSLGELGILRTIGLTTEDVFRWKAAAGYSPFTTTERNAFDSKLAAATTAEFNATSWLNQLWNANLFATAIVLSDSSAGTNFDETTLRFANGGPLQPLDWMKINLFVRLKKKLNWKQDELDTALTCFFPKDTSLTMGNLGEKFKTALIYLSHLKHLHEFFPLGKQGLQKWITLWGNFAHGENSLYRKQFLTASIQREDPVFMHPLGKYLMFQQGGSFVPFAWNPAQAEDKVAGNVGLINHLQSVQGALELSENEMGIILEAHGLSLPAAPLNLATLNLLHGYKVLREATRLSVADILALKQLSGLDPLKSLKAGPLTVLADDYPYSDTIRFLDLAAALKEAGLPVKEMNYLARHVFDPVGPYAVAEKNLLDFIRSLAQEINRIDAEQSAPADNAGFTDEFIYERLLLALSPEVADRFMAMWNDTIALSATVPVPPAQRLPDLLLAADERISIAYNSVAETQSLTYTGVLDQGRLTALSTALTNLQGLPAADPAHISSAQKNLAIGLLSDIHLQSKTFYEDHVFKPIYKEDAAYSFVNFFPVADVSLPEAQQLAVRSDKRAILTKATLQFLKTKLTEAAVTTALAEALALDQAFTRYLIQEKKIGQVNGNALQALYKQANETGISVDFIRNETTGELSGTSVRSTNAGIKGGDIPANTQVVVMQGYLEPKVAEAVRFFVKGSKQNMQVKLFLSHLSAPLIDNTLATDGEEISGFAALEANVPYKFRVEIRNSNGGDVLLSVQSESMPKGKLTQMRTFPLDLVQQIQEAHTLLRKVAQVIVKFALAEKEVRYLVSYPTHYYQFSFSELPVASLDPVVPTEKVLIEKMTKQLLRLAMYVKNRKEIAGGTTALIDLLEMAVDGNAATLNLLVNGLAELTRRQEIELRQIVEHFGYNALAFSTADAISKVWEASKLAHTLGVSASAIASVGGVVSKSSPHHERFKLASAYRQLLKSKYTADNWNRIAQSVFDKMRPIQRDALAAYVMHRKKFDRIEQLFEYFLIDPGMEPVVQTSRIRLAISSVQTFVQRCLLNMEKEVPASILNRSHWQWMKRYRVWEANRKIFLFPENWLEPEFRDDKSHLFEELEGAVLQGDINKEMVEKAFHNYLKGLQQIARLNMVAMYCEEDPVNPSGNTLHVVGKVYSRPSYYYRSYRNNVWTPWVPIPDQIEGEHLALIKWQDRLHIFWLTFVPKSDSKTGDETMEETAQKNKSELVQEKVEVQLNWCEYYEGQWQPRESGGFDNAMRAEVQKFDAAEVYIHASLEYDEGFEKAVKVHLSGNGLSHAFRLVSKLSHPKSDLAFFDAPATPPYNFTKKGKTKYSGVDNLTVTYIPKTTHEVETLNGLITKETYEAPQINKTLLGNMKGTNFLLCNDPPKVSGNPEIDSLVSPFFFEDDEDSITLYAEPELLENTTVTWEEWIIKEQVTVGGDGIDPPVGSHVPYDDWKYINDKIKGMKEVNVFEMRKPKRDWLVNPGTVLQYEEEYIGARGGVQVEYTDERAITPAESVGTNGSMVNVNSGSNFSAGNTVKVTERYASSQGNAYGVNELATESISSINIIGASGLNTVSATQITGAQFESAIAK